MSPRTLPATTSELLNPGVRRGPFRVVLFDFDGTLSLLRECWPRVMVDMMRERLVAAGLTLAPPTEEARRLEGLVLALNGAPTLQQMEAFAAEVRRRGGTPADPCDYLRDYLNRLMAEVGRHWQALTAGTARPADWVVPGTHELLTRLRDRGVPLFVASGTDRADVCYELGLLGLAEFFPAGIHAPQDNDPTFSKRAVIARVLSDLGIRGEELLGFGDGVVETAEVKRAGGVAVGVASAGPGWPPGTIHPGKRDRLAAAGADLIIPDYLGAGELIRWLWNETDTTEPTAH